MVRNSFYKIFGSSNNLKNIVVLRKTSDGSLIHGGPHCHWPDFAPALSYLQALAFNLFSFKQLHNICNCFIFNFLIPIPYFCN